MDLHTKRKVSLRYLVKDQLIILSNHGWQNHRRVCSDTLSRRLLQERLNQESILVEIVRPSIWQLRGSQGREASTPLIYTINSFSCFAIIWANFEYWNNSMFSNYIKFSLYYKTQRVKKATVPNFQSHPDFQIIGSESKILCSLLIWSTWPSPSFAFEVNDLEPYTEESTWPKRMN